MFPCFCYLIELNYRYVSEGSVYFDTHQFHHTQPHVYGKLRPEAIGNLDLMAEGEGGLSAEGIQRHEFIKLLFFTSPMMKHKNRF
jgi:cysteinyl-tRNA synthetase